MEGQEKGQGPQPATHVPPAAIPAQSIERLTRAIERLNRRNTLWFSFWHGLLIGVGSTVGVVVILYGFAWLFSELDFIPGLDRASEVLKNILNQRAGNGQ